MILADKGKRLGGFVVDTIVYFGLYYIIAIRFNFIDTLLIDRDSMYWDILFSALYVAYYFVSEYFFGRTIGKWVTKILVVTKDGARPTASKTFLRSIGRLIPFEGLLYLFFPWLLHDLLSGTIVIKETKEHVAVKPGS